MLYDEKRVELNPRTTECFIKSEFIWYRALRGNFSLIVVIKLLSSFADEWTYMKSENELSTIGLSNVPKALLFGAISGCLSTLLLQLERNLQLDNVSQHLYRQYGLPGFWRGTAMSLYRNMDGMCGARVEIESTSSERGTNHEQFPTALEAMRSILADNETRGVPVMLLVNKADVSSFVGALNPTSR